MTGDLAFQDLQARAITFSRPFEVHLFRLNLSIV